MTTRVLCHKVKLKELYGCTCFSCFLGIKEAQIKKMITNKIQYIGSTKILQQNALEYMNGAVVMILLSLLSPYDSMEMSI